MVLRLFACVVPPESVLDAALRVQRELLGVDGALDDYVPSDRSAHASVSRAFRPVPRENLHVTLHFFGDVDETSVLALIEGLDRLALSRPIPLQTAPAGCFPHCRAPRAVWLGVRDSSGRLAELAMRVVGCAPDAIGATASGGQRPAVYRPHITLARVRPAFVRDPAVVRRVHACVERSRSEVGREWAARTIVLMQSVLSAGGAEYRVVHETNSGGAGH